MPPAPAHFRGEKRAHQDETAIALRVISPPNGAVNSRTFGISKEKFEEAARNAGFRRSTIRDFIDQGIVAGQLKYDKRKLYAKAKQIVEV